MENIGVELLKQRRYKAEHQAASRIAHCIADVVFCFESARARNETLLCRLRDVLRIAHNNSLLQIYCDFVLFLFSS